MTWKGLIHCQKETTSQLTNLFLFSDYSKEIIDILIHLTKYSKTIPWTMAQKTDYEIKSFRVVKQDTEES